MSVSDRIITILDDMAPVAFAWRELAGDLPDVNPETVRRICEVLRKDGEVESSDPHMMEDGTRLPRLYWRLPTVKVENIDLIVAETPDGVMVLEGDDDGNR